MQKMLASLVALTSLAAAPVFAVTDTQGYSSSLQSVTAKTKNAIRPQAAMLSTVRSLDIKIINVSGQPAYALLFAPNDPYNPLLNDFVNNLAIDHFHHNDVTYDSHVVIQNANRTPIMDQALCRYAVVTVFGPNYGQYFVDNKDCYCPIGVC